MKRWAAGLLLVAALLACGGRSGPPHVLLISVDTLRADHLGAYGDPRGLTPRIDALAAESVRFERAYAPAPFTLPSLAGLLTGRHPEALGVHDNVSRLPPETPTLAEHLKGLGYRTAAVVGNGIVRDYTGLARGFQHYQIEFAVGPEGRPRDRSAATTDAALAAVDAVAGDGPVFLWVHYLDPHGPYQPPPGVRERLLPGERARPDGASELELSPNSRGLGVLPRYQYLEPHREVAWYRAGYAGEVMAVDREVGRLLDGLESRGLLARSLVVLTADHGEALGEADYWFAHGERLDEPAVRVPLLVRVPGAEPGVRSAPASLLDVVPTLAARLSAPLEDELPGVDLLAAAPKGPRGLLLATGPAGSSRPARAVVRSGWKLVRFQDGDEVLYQLPDETRDLSAQHPERVRELGAALDAR